MKPKRTWQQLNNLANLETEDDDELDTVESSSSESDAQDG